MSSSGRSKAPRGGKEDHIDDRTSGAVEEPIGKNSEFVSRREFIERLDYESAKNEERFSRLETRIDRLAENTDIKFAEIKEQFTELRELLYMKLTGLPGKEKESPTVSEGTPPPVFSDTGASESIKLSRHFYEDYSPVNPAQHEKEDPVPQSKNRGRLSASFKNAVDMQTLIDFNAGKVEYTKKSPDISGLRLGSLSERDIVEWLNRWDEILAEHPTYPFNFASSISSYIKQKLVTANDITDGLREVNRAGLPELVQWLCTCIRPIDNISFIKALDMNVFFRSKKDFILTERNHRDFYENIKIYNRDFSHLLDLLMDSLHEGQEYPPMNTKEGVGILWVYLKKFPCDYGHAVWIDVPGDKKFKNFSEFLVEFMKVCQKHRMFSEATVKLSHVVSYRQRGGGRGDDYDTRPSEYGHPVGFDDHRFFRPDDKPRNRSPVFVGKNLLHGPGEEVTVSTSDAKYPFEDATESSRGVLPPQNVESRDHREPDHDPKLGESRLSAFAKSSDHFGPNSHYPSNGVSSPTGGPVPLRRPPPVPGVCFEALRSGNCENFDLGCCSYDHSVAALVAYCKKQQENMEAFVSNNPIGGGASKSRA